MDNNKVIKIGHEFPWESLAISVFFILSAQFINRVFLWIPFIIQLYRVLRYDEHVFMVDLAFIVNFGTIFRLPIGGAVGIIIVFADICFLFSRHKYPLTSSLVIAPIIIGYLFFRSSGKFIDYMFIASVLLLLYLLMNTCTFQDSLYIARAFIYGILIASIYGFVFRGSSAISYYIADDSAAIYGVQDAFRFRAIFGDSNYYSCYLILGIILTIELYVLKQSKLWHTVLVLVLFTGFGIATYSRTFFLMLVLLLLCSIYLLFKKQKKSVAILLIIVCVIVVIMIFAGKISIFNVVLSRLFLNEGLSGLTSGRNELFTSYGSYIMDNSKVFFIGEGLGADLLSGIGTHNIYMEIIYFTGILGGGLYFMYIFTLVRIILRKKKRRYNWIQFLISVLPLSILLILYFTLQGMFMTTTYILFFVAITSMLLPLVEKK